MQWVQIVDMDLSTCFTGAGTWIIPSLIVVLITVVELISLNFLFAVKGVLKFIEGTSIVSRVLSLVELIVAILI